MIGFRIYPNILILLKCAGKGSNLEGCPFSATSFNYERKQNIDSPLLLEPKSN